ncbi:hypothetical protein T02_12533 [Trichinella nativa]|uniref:Uncharacterized protein n=1 Tax=Trichinella nativa TaxID=6335 RepID=A0A0V1L3T2_9BILA|nr:hypothetical protein T02_12533 [Trichinella nativa]
MDTVYFYKETYYNLEQYKRKMDRREDKRMFFNIEEFDVETESVRMSCLTLHSSIEYIHKRSLKMANVHPTTSILITAKFSLSKLFLKIITLNIGKISIERNSTQVMFITIKTCGGERSVQKTGDGVGAKQVMMHSESDAENGIVLKNCESRSLYTLHAHFSIQLIEINLSILYIIKNNVKQGMAIAYG